jgi:hypothetical protein
MASTTETQIQFRPFPQGSIWRKWDLHVHSPLSVLNNQYPHLPDGQGPDWESYVGALESLTDMAVLGITDYFSIEGFKKVQGFRQQGRLKNVKCILPNIELRLDTFVVQEKAHDINFHIIFSDELHPEDIEKEFIEALQIRVSGSIAGLEGIRQLTPRNLIQLGQEIKRRHSIFQKDGDIEAAVKNITVSLEQVQELLRKDLFQNRFLYALAGAEWGDIDWNQAYLTKKNFFQSAHILDTASPSTIEWALGKKNRPGDFLKEFGRQKPCIHASDAHRIEDIAKPTGNRFTWIKSDPTFEGLRQIIFEPEERVFIGENPPNLKQEHQVIAEVQVSGSDSWFASTPIPLNRDLVAIVGGRGSGKSALAEVIALAGRAQLFSSKRKEKIEDTFLHKASKRSATNPTPITGAKISITWADGSSEIAEVNQNLFHDGKEEKVKYLPQKFVEFLCAPENTQDIEEEIERVIFQRLDKTQRLGVSDYRELRDRSTKSINLRKRKLAESLLGYNRTIAELNIHIGQKEAKEKLVAAKKRELAKMEQNKPIVPPEEEGEIEKLNLLEKEKRGIEQRIVMHSQQLESLQSIKAKMQLFAEEAIVFNAEMTELLNHAGLSADVESFTIHLNETYDIVLERRKKELESEIATLRNGGESIGIETLSLVINKINEIKSRSQFVQESREAFEKYQNDYVELTEAISSLENELSEIASVLIPRQGEEEAKRVEKYLDFFGLLEEEKLTLERLYEPLRTALLAGNETDQKLSFVARFSLDAAALSRQGLDIIDRTRKGKYREDCALESALKRFWIMLENDSFQRDSIKTQIEEFRRSFQKDESGEDINIGDQLRKGKSIQNFDDWFFNTEYFSVVYSIKFDGKDLQLLSPGQKGIVLLLVYLEVDQHDNRPLIIDQPEDNLDNLSVYQNLINYFRKRKKTRQIIIITHNPNLVVNTDAEQMIVADFDGGATPRITYVSGAIEDTKAVPNRGVRERVCDVLEGGTEAFRRREEKYSLPPI